MEITKELVRRLVNTQFPHWKELEIQPVARGGHDNRTFHLGNEMIVRLPSGPEYVAQVEKEAKWLPALQEKLSLPVPRPLALGRPSEEYPFPWSVNRYIEGETADEKNIAHMEEFAEELGLFLKELQGIGTEGAPEAGEHNFFRGASPAVYHKDVEKALRSLDRDWPVQLLKTVWAKATASVWSDPPVWIHGDIAPGNLLVKEGRLCGVIDFGIMGIGDPACDYAMAWTFFEGNSRRRFLRGLDRGTICRARGWALWKALITCHDADERTAENARRTLNNILHEQESEMEETK